jgi:hypothetical protein
MEVQRAHDILLAFILEEVPKPADIPEQAILMAASTLCWVLKHDHNHSFGEVVAQLESEANKAGFTLSKPLAN